MSEYREITSADATFVYTRILDTGNCSHEADPNELAGTPYYQDDTNAT